MHSSVGEAPGLQVVLRGVLDDDEPCFFEHKLDTEATAMARFPTRDREA